LTININADSNGDLYPGLCHGELLSAKTRVRQSNPIRHQPQKALILMLFIILIIALLNLNMGCQPKPKEIIESIEKAAPFKTPPGILRDRDLTEHLKARWNQRKDGYRPRTKHLESTGDPKYINRLFLESSPYLKQHAHNPVDWRSWNEATLEEAKSQNKLIFLSVGYSTCHWCHVMEEESFEDKEIAEYINKNYIA